MFGCPDELKGEAVVAVVVAKDGVVLDGAALIKQLHDEISAYKIPSRIVVMNHDDLPRTDSGKPKKNLLRDRVMQGR